MPSKIKIIRKCEEVYNIQLENGHWALSHAFVKAYKGDGNE
jgi:hypothetical protein